jgi:diguanylate cyclase (GGDEF)-like protein
MENSRLVERLRNLSVRDSLTDLFNHRHSMELVDQEFQRVGRYPAHEGISLLMIDIDDFKRINDSRGHLAGDAVLREVAHVLKDSLRSVDSVGRYGGEEFVVILPHTPRDEAMRTAERIRQRDGERRRGHVPLRRRRRAQRPRARGGSGPVCRQGRGAQPGRLTMTRPLTRRPR